MKKRQLSLLAIMTFVIYAMSTYDFLINLQVEASNASSPLWKPWSVLGEQKLAVICTEFSDVTHSVDNQTIENRLDNMTKYFGDISFGKITVNATFYGNHWERLNNTMAHYGNGSYDQDNNGWQFITDSLRAWEKYVNFSNYDYVLVIHAGEDQSSNINESELLWRHSFCSFGHTAKINVRENESVYSFWGLSYDSEFEEWGLIAHEMGHGLGLPDLYIANETRPMDSLSLMAKGDRNGFPEGTLPASLEGFGMFMMGWIHPQEVSLNYTKDLLNMTPLEYGAPTLLRINLTESTYYLVEVREKTGYDKEAVDSTSLIVWLINENRPSGNGTAVVFTSGILNEGQIYSDSPNGIFLRFISFNSTTHTAQVELSSNMFFVDMDFPDSVQLFSSINGIIRVFDSNNRPAQYFAFNVSVDNIHYSQLTDSKGEARINLGELGLGTHTIEVLSPQLTTGELETTIEVIVPWAIIAAAVFLFLFIVTLIFCYLKRR